MQVIASAEGRKTKADKRGPGRPSLSNEELLDKALDLFLEQGFERTSIDAITAAAGMAKRTVYLRYGDKKSLFQAALRRAIEDSQVPIEDLRTLESEDIEKTLLDVGRTLVANVTSPASLRLHRIQNAESGRMPEIGAAIYRQGTERLIGYVADLLRRRIGPDTVAMSEWNEAAIAFMYLVVCGPPTMTVYGVPLDKDWIETHTRYCVRLFLHGLLPRRAGDAPTDVRDLEHENRRLRDLLVKTMLENAALKEQQNTETP